MKQELITYARGLNAKPNIITLINKLYTNQDLGEFEHIIDYLIHKDFEDLSWASYDLLLEKSKKWTRLLTQNVLTIDEEYGTDIQIILDFEDGFKWVKLLSKNAYTREGNMMSHCVESYYGRDVEIFSLRDSFNKPHCTIEKDRQIKGKGNGDISPKYIDYVVRFLEYTGMKVRDSEMAHLGYRVAKFPKYVTNKLYRERYIRNDEVEVYKDDVVVVNGLDDIKKKHKNRIVLFNGNIKGNDADHKRFKYIREIGGYADFEGSQITNLRQLQSIGGYADFEGSQITNLGQLQSIGGYADFRNSQITNLRQLQSIGDSADFKDSMVTSLGQLQSIGGYADFEGSQITNLGQLQSIGGSAYFKDSMVTSLGQLQSIGGSAYFSDSNITDLGQLQSIGRSAYFRCSQITNLRQLQSIGDSADFRCSQVTQEHINKIEIKGSIYK